MSEQIVEIISKLGVDASEVYTELDKVKAKYQQNVAVITESQKQLEDLTAKEAALVKARNASNNPTLVALYNSKISETKTAIKGVADEIVKQTNLIKGNSTAINQTGEDLRKAFDATLTKGLNGEILATRSNYIKLRTELANSTGTDQAEHLAVEMGKVKHELDLASESAKAFGSENKFRESGILLEEIGASLLKLDFRGAASKAKLLADLAKTISFKDVVKAVGQIGETLANVGEALLKNPLFLLVAAMAAVVEITKSVIESNVELKKTFDENEKEIQKIVDATEDLVRANRDLGIENDLLANKITKTNAEKLKNQNSFKDAFVKLAKEEAAQKQKIEDDFTASRKDHSEKDALDALSTVAGFAALETESSKLKSQTLKRITEESEKERQQLRIKFGQENTKILETEAKEELDIIRKLTTDVRNLREKNQLEDIKKALDERIQLTTSSIDQIQKTAALERKIAAENIADETKQNIKGLDDRNQIAQIEALEKKKLSAEIVGINQKEAKDILAVKKEVHEKVVELNKTAITDEADLNKALLELAINNSEAQSNGQVDSYSARIKLTNDYYSALISITKANTSERELLEAQLNSALIKLDKDHQKEVFQLQNDALTEEQRHQAVLLGLRVDTDGNTHALQIAQELAFEKQRLILMEQSGVATEAELKKQHNKIEELEAEHNAEIKKMDKKHFEEYLDELKTVVDAAIAAGNKILDAEIKRVDAQISLQQARVDAVAAIAENGNAELLELEKKRLSDLTKEKEKFVRQQQTLAVIELVANTAVAVSKAAAEGGAAAGFTIAAALIALIAGLASARSIAGQAAFFSGGEGYTGDGNIHDESTAVGTKAYKYHKREFIFNNEKTSKYIDVFRKVHTGQLDLNQMKFEADMYKTLKDKNIDTSRDIYYRPMEASQSNEIGKLKATMENIVDAIKAQPGMSVHIDENGIAVITNRYFKNKKRINTISR